MTTPTPRTGEIDELANAMWETGAVRIVLDDLWRMWAAAAPRLVGDPAQASALAQALTDLSERGVVELPLGAWDTSTTPPLPRSLVIPTARRPTRTRAWVRYPWRHELGWAASLSTLSDDRMRDLAAINNWLRTTNGGQVPIVPIRYRSVEILGNEKALEAMVRTNLFGPGRLTLELLACVYRPAPLPAMFIGPGPDLLVVENSDPYWVAGDILGRRDDHPIGAIAWGSGRTFSSQVGALEVDVAGRGPVAGRVWYWGDLDPAGLAIAADAARVANASNGRPIRPATGLWTAMADRPIQQAGTVDWSTAPGRDWLGPTAWMAIGPIRVHRGRVAQEALPAEAVLDWALSL